MTFQHTVRMKVPFHDLDPLQVVWHGNYLKYFDVTRFALFSAAGIDLMTYQQEKQIMFPVTRTAVKHIHSLGPFDEFDCTAVVAEAYYKLTLHFEIRLASSGKLCARGSSDQVAVTLPDKELQFEIPADIRAALGCK